LLRVVELPRGATPLTDTLTIAIRSCSPPNSPSGLSSRRGKRASGAPTGWPAVALVRPAVRVRGALRIVRLLRLGRGARVLRMARLLTSFDRGMRALGTTMRTRGFPDVLALTVGLVVLGGAGMYTFERDGGSRLLDARILTLVGRHARHDHGSEYWPRTVERRLICLLLSIYAFAMFGCITATLASFFVGADRPQPRLEGELAELRRALETVATRTQASRLSRSAWLCGSAAACRPPPASACVTVSARGATRPFPSAWDDAASNKIRQADARPARVCDNPAMSISRAATNDDREADALSAELPSVLQFMQLLWAIVHGVERL
jgi:hypothetical protein